METEEEEEEEEGAGLIPPPSPLLVAPADTVKAGTFFTMQNLSYVRVIPGAQMTTKIFRILVRAKADQRNDDPALRVARVECELFRWVRVAGGGDGTSRDLVVRSAIELKVRNCVRPLFRNASLRIGRNGNYADSENSNSAGANPPDPPFTSVITSRGAMEVVTSGGAGVQLRLQAPASVTGRTFDATGLRAFAVSRKGSTHALQILTELPVVSVSQEGREVVLSLPTLSDVFATHKTPASSATAPLETISANNNREMRHSCDGIVCVSKFQCLPIGCGLCA